MAKYCPVLKEKVVYLICEECEEKACKIPYTEKKDKERTP